MKEKILQMVDAYWKFDEAQQPMSSWHDKQDLLKALEELLQPAVSKSEDIEREDSVCDHTGENVIHKVIRYCKKCDKIF